MTTSQLSPADQARQNAARQTDGTFGTQTRSEPSIAPLPAVPATSFRPAEEGTGYTLTPADHGIEGLGPVTMTRTAGQTTVTLSHPDGTDLSDLYNWDSGSSDVRAKDQAQSVLDEHLGLAPTYYTERSEDRLEINDGVLTLTMNVPGDEPVDFEDLASWAADFIDIASSDVVRSGLQEQIQEAYDS